MTVIFFTRMESDGPAGRAVDDRVIVDMKGRTSITGRTVRIRRVPVRMKPISKDQAGAENEGHQTGDDAGDDM